MGLLLFGAVPFRSMSSFLWSSIRVRVILVGICSFLVLICHELRWIPWIRNHEFHHGLAFSSLIFCKCRFELIDVFFRFRIFFEPLSLFCHIVNPFGFFVMFFGCLILVQNRSVFFLHPVVGMFSCHLLPVVDRIFFSCFGMSCFVCIVFSLSISL